MESERIAKAKPIKEFTRLGFIEDGKLYIFPHRTDVIDQLFEEAVRDCEKRKQYQYFWQPSDGYYHEHCKSKCRYEECPYENLRNFEENARTEQELKELYKGGLNKKINDLEEKLSRLKKLEGLIDDSEIVYDNLIDNTKDKELKEYFKRRAAK